MKPGKTEAAARAISSHSGTMSGADLIYNAAFKKAGVIRTENTTQLLDATIGLLTQPLPRGRNVVITTPGGSYGVMCAEACALRGLKVIDLPREVMETFNAMFPSRWSHGNPVDPAGDRDFVQYLRAPEILLKHPEVDAIIFMGFGSFSGLSSTFAGGMDKSRYKMLGGKLEGLTDMARAAIQILDDKDPLQIKEIIKTGLSMTFQSIMSTSEANLMDFTEILAGALTTDKMLESSFYGNLRTLFAALADGNLEDMKIESILQLMEPIIGALINNWIEKYEKPVITTTFTEVASRLSEEGHFPYPNAERASTVLAKLVEYGEYLSNEN